MGSLVFIALFACYFAAANHEAKDSRYALVLSQALLYQHTFELDRAFVPPASDGAMRLESVSGHLFYYFPPGSSLLSLPAVAVLNLFGLSAINPVGRYDQPAEERMQALLAAALMAALAVLVLAMAWPLLTPGWSLAVVAGVALGSPIWSTAALTLWSDTWGDFLLAWVIVLLLRLDRDAGEARRVSAVLLSTLLCWAYFTRPTQSLAILAVGVYLLAWRRRLLPAFALTGMVWLALFVTYSRHHFGTWLPSYFRADRLAFGSFRTALAANLWSPSRGLLVFVPTLLFVGWLLLRYRRTLVHRRLAGLAVAVVALHLILVSGYWQWWAGHSYGPRFGLALVPWFALLAILGVRATLEALRRAPAGPVGHRLRVLRWAGATLLAASVLLNAPGALSPAAERWNKTPVDVDRAPGRVFDWSDPQFLAPLRRH
ncbi:MAG TPA: hypothetical protein VHR45_01210 [Thermoanaerobaculia bacterium]|nr:hypothetical protein [Thermoanaerobaculia bacterium]